MLEILVMVLTWLFFVLYVEAVTEIIVDSDFFFPIRNFIAGLSCVFSDITFIKACPDKKKWYQLPLVPFIACIRLFGKFCKALLSCGYCVSVWVAASVAWMLPGSPASHSPIELPAMAILIIDIILKTFVLHRLSNWQHEATVRWLKRIPFFGPPTVVDNQEIVIEDNGDDQTGNKEGSM